MKKRLWQKDWVRGVFGFLCFVFVIWFCIWFSSSLAPKETQTDQTASTAQTQATISQTPTIVVTNGSLAAPLSNPVQIKEKTYWSKLKWYCLGLGTFLIIGGILFVYFPIKILASFGHFRKGVGKEKQKDAGAGEDKTDENPLTSKYGSVLAWIKKHDGLLYGILLEVVIMMALWEFRQSLPNVVRGFYRTHHSFLWTMWSIVNVVYLVWLLRESKSEKFSGTIEELKKLEPWRLLGAIAAVIAAVGIFFWGRSHAGSENALDVGIITNPYITVYPLKPVAIGGVMGLATQIGVEHPTAELEVSVDNRKPIKFGRNIPYDWSKKNGINYTVTSTNNFPVVIKVTRFIPERR